MLSESEDSEAMQYVNSLDDAMRRYASEYLVWMRGDQEGLMPDQGPLSFSTVRMISRTLDRLAKEGEIRHGR
jgi:hypothetical protein